MVFDKQKNIKKEVDSLFPKKKGDWEHNLCRCKYNAIRMHGASKEETLKKMS